MHSNKPNAFSIVANLVRGQPADGTALARALFYKIDDQTLAF